MATPQDKFKSRCKMFKVTTGFKYDSDTGSSAHFVWARDADDALKIVAEHAHKCKLVDIEMYDQVKPDDSEAFHHDKPNGGGGAGMQERAHPGFSERKSKSHPLY